MSNKIINSIFIIIGMFFFYVILRTAVLKEIIPTIMYEFIYTFLFLIYIIPMLLYSILSKSKFVDKINIISIISLLFMILVIEIYMY